VFITLVAVAAGAIALRGLVVMVGEVQAHMVVHPALELLVLQIQVAVAEDLVDMKQTTHLALAVLAWLLFLLTMPQHQPQVRLQ
jgi:hypothetical protein